MTTHMELNRVLDANTWEVLGDQCSAALASECACSSDGTAYATLSHGVWHRADVEIEAQRRVLVGIPALTSGATFADVAELTRVRRIRITRMGMNEYGVISVRITDVARDREWWAQDVEAWRAVNKALWKMESGRE